MPVAHTCLRELDLGWNSASFLAMAHNVPREREAVVEQISPVG